jgi:hypothetical protein
MDIANADDCKGVAEVFISSVCDVGTETKVDV